MSEGSSTSRRAFLRMGTTGAIGLGLLDTRLWTAPSAWAAAPGAATKLGGSLIGKLEGAEVVTDPSKFPKKFSEARQMAELVKSGKLPPVEQRIGQDPLVLKPVHEIGKYGGTWRRAFTGPSDSLGGARAASGPDNPVFWDYTGQKVVPNLVKAWEFQDEGRTLVLHLRRGMRWSDGHPFTADDWVFWFEDLYSNKDITPGAIVEMVIDGKPGRVEKLDDYTVAFKYGAPCYLLPEMMCSNGNLTGHAVRGQTAMGGFAPAHYLKQFHLKYVPKEEIDKRAAERGFNNWVTMLRTLNTWHLNPDLPSLTPWRTVSPANRPQWTLERNPYYWAVDTQGNQLPYIDRVIFTLAENLEVANLRAIAGEYDMQERHIGLDKLPVLLRNQEKGGYKIWLDPSAFGCDMTIRFNLSYEADPEIARWLSNTDFRRALSLGVDRDQLNETFWLGMGVPGSIAPADDNIYSPGPEYRTLWSTYNANRANALLDQIGLNNKDAEGYRQRTDGKGRLRLEWHTLVGQLVPHTQIAEMVRNQWKKIGIDVNVTEVERGLAEKRAAGNEIQLLSFNADGTDNIFAFPASAFPYNVVGITSDGGPLYARWYNSDGARGKEPPAHLKRVYELHKKGFSASDQERIGYGKEIWSILVDQVYTIGTVGLSPASSGVRLVKNSMRNVPQRLYNSSNARSPCAARPATFYFG